MAILEPAAIRCGLLPRDTWTMTIAELLAVISEKNREKEDDRRYLDLLNAKHCAVDAALRGVSSAPADHMITKDVKGALHHG